MIKNVVIALSGALIAAASPAFAEGARTADLAAAMTSNVAAVETPAAKPAASKQRYCIDETTTGSRLARRTCRTRDDWLSEGFDPLAKK